MNAYRAVLVRAFGRECLVCHIPVFQGRTVSAMVKATAFHFGIKLPSKLQLGVWSVAFLVRDSTPCHARNSHAELHRS